MGTIRDSCEGIVLQRTEQQAHIKRRENREINKQIESDERHKTFISSCFTLSFISQSYTAA